MKQTGLRLAEIVERLGGEVRGDPATEVFQVATLEKAGSGQIAFLANARYRQQLADSRASAVILAENDAALTALPRIVAAHPYSYFAKLSALLNPVPELPPGIHPTAVVAADAFIAPDAHIGAQVCIGAGARIEAGAVVMAGCVVGERTILGAQSRLYPNVTIYHDCLIGRRVILHSGVVIGADGFGIAMDEGRWLKIPQIGRVLIGDDVEIGANTTVDRGALDDTVIEEGVKLDNQVQVAHNVHIGAHTAIAGCVGIAGSARIGRYCRIGGSAGILGHLQIADHVEIASFTLVGKSISEAGSYAGIYPFSKKDEWRNNAVHLRHLDELAKRIVALEKEMQISRESKHE